ncbi:acetate/propionate family kinase [Plantactinospora sp. WMMC1484]|uniref:acetate/propionate family kinase n=1 Tax=Plantactinospora sp. WMMC1484 TaxID=3404122 RepID=UPI003BF4F1D1
MHPPTAPILALNAGSSSLKYALLRGGARLAAGSVPRIGEPGAPVADHAEAVARVLDDLARHHPPPAAVGHRVVHGGARFHRPTLIDDAVLASIEELSALAPLHNPPGLAVIRAARRALPGVPQVAVFDTAFHAGMPPEASGYALDRETAARYGIRRYGFHGISVRYVTAATATLLGRPLPDLNMVVLHLGNGASATAVAGGRGVDTSMGMTPLEGLVMGTRTGDIDPAVVFHLARAGLPLDRIEELYQHGSGLLGLSGENDMRGVLARAERGDEAAEHAVASYCYRIRKYVGAYQAVLGRLDAVVFTAGVGEHSPAVRSRSLAGLTALGITVDPSRNASGAPARVISPETGRVAVCVVPTDEERGIVEETAATIPRPGRG